MEQKLEYLMQLTKNRLIDKIKFELENLDVTIKGIIFEKYLVELFKGNGWLAVRKGGKSDAGADILICNPKRPDSIFTIIQAKNWKVPLDFDRTKIELIKFEDKSRHIYKCNSYMIISINSFVEEGKKLGEFNMRLEDWSYVVGLIYNFKDEEFVEPNIELLAHNKLAYDNSKRVLTFSNKVAFVQATGTGKSYLIIKYILDYIGKGVLVLAPSRYILEQIQTKYFWLSEAATYMTYAKLKNLTEDEMKKFKYDLIILDEFHRCGAELWGLGVRRLLNSNIESVVIGTSATPIRYLDDNRNMAEELFENNLAIDLSLHKAINKHILPMPIYVSSLYTLDEDIIKLDRKVNNLNISLKDKKLLKDELHLYRKNWEKSNGIPSILAKYINKDKKKFIIFCENKTHLAEMEWLVESWFKKAKLCNKVVRYRITSEENDNDNFKILREFRGSKPKSEFHLLFTIDMLNEGLHIDSVAGVILLRETRSPRIFYQQIGRAIQCGNSESPLIFDFVNNSKNLCCGDFLNHLCYAQNEENKRRNLYGLSNNDMRFTVIDESEEVTTFFRNIEFKLSSNWEFRFKELVEYKDLHGDCLVPKKQRDLYAWCTSQRREYKRNELKQDKINMLNEIAFVWDLLEYEWLEMYNRLKEYKKNYGSCRVTRNYNEDKKLAYWVGTQRKFRIQNSLSEMKINLLDELDFEWTYDEKWMKGYEELKRYKQLYGDCNVPRDYKFNNFNLGSWTNLQGQYYRSENKLLTEDKIVMLKELGFNSNRFESTWNEMFEELVKLKEETGKLTITREKNNKLANWILNQRKAFRQEKLSEEKVKMLNSIGFNFR